MKNVRMTIWMMIMSICLCVLPSFGLTQFKDGQTHNIDYEINDDAWVDYQSPGMRTTVNWLDGASIPHSYDLRAFEDSRLNVSGGSMSDLYAYDSSQVTMSGGSIDARLNAYDSTQVTIFGGSMNLLYAYGTSQVDFSGGSIDQSLVATGSSRVTISGGSIRYNVNPYNSSRVTISGGSIGSELRVGNSAILTIHGSDFAVDGESFGYGELTSMLSDWWYEDPVRHLTGTLASGDLLNVDFRIGHDASISLVPEPATLLLLSLGGAVLIRKIR